MSAKNDRSVWKPASICESYLCHHYNLMFENQNFNLYNSLYSQYYFLLIFIVIIFIVMVIFSHFGICLVGVGGLVVRISVFYIR